MKNNVQSIFKSWFSDAICYNHNFDILVWFYGISSILGYLMPNPVHIFDMHIYDL